MAFLLSLLDSFHSGFATWLLENAPLVQLDCKLQGCNVWYCRSGSVVLFTLYPLLYLKMFLWWLYCLMEIFLVCRLPCSICCDLWRNWPQREHEGQSWQRNSNKDRTFSKVRQQFYWWWVCFYKWFESDCKSMFVNSCNWTEIFNCHFKTKNLCLKWLKSLSSRS